MLPISTVSQERPVAGCAGVDVVPHAAEEVVGPEDHCPDPRGVDGRLELIRLGRLLRSSGAVCGCSVPVLLEKIRLDLNYRMD